MMPNSFIPPYMQMMQFQNYYPLLCMQGGPQLYPFGSYFNNSGHSNFEQKQKNNTVLEKSVITKSPSKLVIEEAQKKVHHCERLEDQNMEHLQNDYKMRTRQKYGRNITSNIFRSLIKRICNQVRFKKLIRLIIQRNKFQITYEEFIEDVSQKSVKLGSYIKKNEMLSFYYPSQVEDKQKQKAYIFRIAARIYLRQEHTLSVFHSKKISKQSRSLHFALARQMQQSFR